MSETSGVLAGTLTTAALNSAIGYMTPERRARLARAARHTARERPALVAIAAAALTFIVVRAIRAGLEARKAEEDLPPPAPEPVSWPKGAPYGAH
jgi:hypothetical protein